MVFSSARASGSDNVNERGIESKSKSERGNEPSKSATASNGTRGYLKLQILQMFRIPTETRLTKNPFPDHLGQIHSPKALPVLFFPAKFILLQRAPHAGIPAFSSPLMTKSLASVGTTFS